MRARSHHPWTLTVTYPVRRQPHDRRAVHAHIVETTAAALYCGMSAQSLDADGRPICTLDGRTGHTGGSWSGGDLTVDVLCGVKPATDEARRPCRALTERASTVTRAKVIRAVATAIDHRPAGIREVVEQVLARAEVVALAAAAGMGSRPERRRYSTVDLLEIERTLAEGALSRRGEGAGRVDPTVLAATEAAHPELSGEQRTVLHRLLGSGTGSR